MANYYNIRKLRALSVHIKNSGELMHKLLDDLENTAKDEDDSFQDLFQIVSLAHAVKQYGKEAKKEIWKQLDGIPVKETAKGEE